MALSCWRRTYSRWLRPISSWTWLLIFSRTFSTSCWRDRNCSTLRMRRLEVERLEDVLLLVDLDVEVGGDEVGQLARLGDAVDQRGASLGSSGISLMTRLATSLRFITSASSSTSPLG